MTDKRFKKIAVLMGGPSAERDVSLCSGAAVAGGLREAGYDVLEIDLKGYELGPMNGVDAVFIALHGEFGEDGRVQEELEQRGVPYAGSGPAASRAAFDKKISKEVFVRNDITTPGYEVLRAGDARTLDLPVVVKPACQGSTIGVHCVKEESEWGDACEDALSYCPDVIVEEYIEGRELTVGIVGSEPMPVVEIVAPDGWYGYDAKYTSGACDYLVPAPVDADTYNRCQRLGVKTFTTLGCRGFARVDYRLSESGELYVLELNSIPGFTETSLLPKAAAEAGIEFAELCDRIVSGARLEG